MTDPEAAPRGSQDRLFQTVKNDANDKWILALKALLNKKREPWFSNVAAAVNDKEPVVYKWHHTTNCCPENEHMIAGEVKSAVKEFSYERNADYGQGGAGRHSEDVIPECANRHAISLL